MMMMMMIIIIIIIIIIITFTNLTIRSASTIAKQKI